MQTPRNPTPFGANLAEVNPWKRFVSKGFYFFMLFLFSLIHSLPYRFRRIFLPLFSVGAVGFRSPSPATTSKPSENSGGFYFFMLSDTSLWGIFIVIRQR